MKWYLRKEVQIGWLVALLIFPVVLWTLPGDTFDDSEVIICPSRAWFDIECPGCGMTRGVMHMHHAEVAEALYYNFGSPFIYPVLIALWILLVYRTLVRLEIIKGKWARRPKGKEETVG